jgi:hypothetical protein
MWHVLRHPYGQPVFRVATFHSASQAAKYMTLLAQQCSDRLSVQFDERRWVSILTPDGKRSEWG